MFGLSWTNGGETGASVVSNEKQSARHLRSIQLHQPRAKWGCRNSGNQGWPSTHHQHWRCVFNAFPVVVVFCLFLHLFLGMSILMYVSMCALDRCPLSLYFLYKNPAEVWIGQRPLSFDMNSSQRADICQSSSAAAGAFWRPVCLSHLQRIPPQHW